MKIVLSRPLRVADTIELQRIVRRQKVWSLLYLLGIVCFFLASLSVSGAIPYLLKWQYHLYFAAGLVLVLVNVQHLSTFAYRERGMSTLFSAQEEDTDHTGRVTEMICTFVLTVGSLMLANSALIVLINPQHKVSKSTAWQLLLSYVAFLVGASANGISCRSSSSEILETRNAIIFQYVVGSSSGLIGRVIGIPGLVCNNQAELKAGVMSWLQGISGALMLLGACLNYLHTEVYFEYERLRLEEIFDERAKAKQLDDEYDYNRKHGRLWMVRRFIDTIREKRLPNIANGLPLPLPQSVTNNAESNEVSSYVTVCSESDASESEDRSMDSLLSCASDSGSEEAREVEEGMHNDERAFTRSIE